MVFCGLPGGGGGGVLRASTTGLLKPPVNVRADNPVTAWSRIRHPTVRLYPAQTSELTGTPIPSPYVERSGRGRHVRPA